MFSEKLKFDNGTCRTKEINHVFGLIDWISNDLEGKKNKPAGIPAWPLGLPLMLKVATGSFSFYSFKALIF